MRVGEKGQVTIPKPLRDALGIGPGSDVEFEQRGETLVLKRVEGGGSRGAELVGRLRGRGDVRLSTDEIMALTRST